MVNGAEGHLGPYTEKALPGVHTCESACGVRLLPAGKRHARPAQAKLLEDVTSKQGS